MRMKRGSLPLAGLLAFTFTFGACGKKEDKTEAPRPEPPQSAPAQPSAPSEQGTPGGGEQKAAPGQAAPSGSTEPEKKDEGGKTK